MNIGMVLPNLGSSQLSFLTISQANVGSGLTNDEFFIFTKNPSEPCVSPAFSCMNISEVIGFKGILFAVDLDGADLIRTVATQSKLVFYVWDLEFLRKKKDFIRNVEIYRDRRLTLVARSQSHANVISNYCNREPDMIVPNFNILAMRERVTGERYEFHSQLRQSNIATI